MATFQDPLTGDFRTLDLAVSDARFPAVLTSMTVDEGLPITDQRYRMPAQFDGEVILSGVAGANSENAEDVRSWIETKANEGARLTLVFDGLPTMTNMMIGTRGQRENARTTTTSLSVSLRESRIAREAVGLITQPTPRADLVDERSAQQEGGEQATEEVGDVKAEQSKLRALLYGPV